MKMISKKLNLRKITTMLVAAMALSMFYSCSDDDSNGSDGMATLRVSMTDAPGDYEAVWVDVKDVMIKTDASTGDEGWVSLTGVEPRRYDLLLLTGGVTELLATAEVEPGMLGQIRLVLGTDNTIVLKNTTEEITLSTPSAQQSGLKLQVNQELEAGKDYEFLLDFDVDQSIVSAGNSGQYILKPVIRLAAVEGSATISGEVQPSDFQSVVKIQNAANSITAYTAQDGKFSLNGVPAGTYQFTVTPEASSGYNTFVVNNVVVTSGEEKEMEPIFLTETGQ
jgi:hypothetical protein